MSNIYFTAAAEKEKRKKNEIATTICRLFQSGATFLYATTFLFVLSVGSCQEENQVQIVRSRQKFQPHAPLLVCLY